MEDKLITSEEVERLVKLKAGELDTDEDLIKLSDVFDEDGFEPEESAPEPEQSLEFLIGGERYIQD